MLHTRFIKLAIVFIFIGATLITSAQAQSPAPTAPPSDLDAYVTSSMKTFDVPGMAVAIVKDGKVVVAKGYGVRKLGDPTPVDEFTLFGIGSNTKAFTTAALATLIDEGKLSWDDPVYQRLPGFVMYDPYVSHEMTIRDLLTHRSGMGLGEGDLLFWPHSTYTRDEIIYKLRFMKPASSFRSLIISRIAFTSKPLPLASAKTSRISAPMAAFSSSSFSTRSTTLLSWSAD